MLSGAARVGACRQERTRHARVSVMRRNVQRGEAGFRARVGVVLILRIVGEELVELRTRLPNMSGRFSLLLKFSFLKIELAIISFGLIEKRGNLR